MAHGAQFTRIHLVLAVVCIALDSLLSDFIKRRHSDALRHSKATQCTEEMLIVRPVLSLDRIKKNLYEISHISWGDVYCR